MGTPRHKIFFGASEVKPKKGLTLKPVQDPGGGPVQTVPCWTWDTAFPVFSSNSKTFDCDYSVAELEQ